MVIKKFEDIIAWQKAQDLAVDIYSMCVEIRDYGFKNQICNAAVSISSNIAEGFDRSSDADFSRFLYIAIASSSETRSILYLAGRLKYVNEDKKMQMIERCDEVSRIIRGLIKSLSKS